MGCPRWRKHCILWCGMKGIAPTSNFFLQPLKGVSDPPDRTAGPSRYFPIPASIACLSGCPVGRWAGHRRWTGTRIGGSGYSLKALYINSSSSRERLFLWTSAFSSTLARTCVAAKYVGGARKVRGSSTTTFGRRRFVWITAWLCQKCAQGYPQPRGLRTLARLMALYGPPEWDRPRKNPAFFVERRVGRVGNGRGA